MKKKSLSRALHAAMLATAAMLLGAPAHAANVGCGNYQPGMLAFMTGTRPSPCAYQGDYMAAQGPAYTGPARVAPQPTYAPTRTAADYPYVREQIRTEAPAAERVTVRKRTVRSTTRSTTVKRTAAKRMVVNVKNDLPPRKGKVKNDPPRKGKVQVVHARAEVRIYSPERMDIRLYRR